ncbi:MAG: hypothetical protein IPO40_24270 [Fibrobacteres bacterium]|nr:hypothetical protein [Fibrobacterota bacterium]
MKSDRSLFWSIWDLGGVAFVIAVDATLIRIVPATVLVIAFALILFLFLIDFLTASYLGVVGAIVIPLMMYALSVSESVALMSGVLLSGYAIGRLNLSTASGLLIKCVNHSGNSSIDEISLLGSQEGWLFVKSY